MVRKSGAGTDTGISTVAGIAGGAVGTSGGAIGVGTGATSVVMDDFVVDDGVALSIIGDDFRLGITVSLLTDSLPKSVGRERVGATIGAFRSGEEGTVVELGSCWAIGLNWGGDSIVVLGVAWAIGL